MTTLTAIALQVADSWAVSAGSGWIVLMLIGMGACFLFMFGAMWVMRGGHGWPMCGNWWRQETADRSDSADTLAPPDDVVSASGRS
jgi:hypothetical protein